jgi:hypothetical protein
MGAYQNETKKRQPKELAKEVNRAEFSGLDWPTISCQSAVPPLLQSPCPPRG